MKYLPLFSLDIVHDYYSDRKFADFQIVPTEGTLRLIGNFRCILKNNPGGIRILVPVTDGDTPFITHPIGLVFGFRLQLQNPDFPLFTDMSVIDKLESPIYINSGSEPNLKLADRARNAVIQKMHQAFAEVEITIRLPELFFENREEISASVSGPSRAVEIFFDRYQ